MKSRLKLILCQSSIPVLAAVSWFLGGAGAAAATYPDTILADKPLIYYRFEDPADSYTAADSSAAGTYTANLTFDAWATYPKLRQPGIGSNSVRFHPYTDALGNPQVSFLSLPYTTDMNKSEPFSVEAWVRPTSAGTGDNYRSPIGNFGGWGDASGWFIYQTPGASSSWVWVQKGGAIWVGQVPIRKGEWDHLVASFDGTTVTFYVNGENKGTANASTAAPNSGKDFCIGQRADAYGYFDGNVDEVAFYTNALTADQVKLHYEVGLTNFYSGPIPALVYQDPATTTVYAGHTVKFETGADGTAPLSYQWYRGNTAIPGATADTYSFDCVYADNNASFKVVVTNLYGSSTSAPATLTVSTDLMLASTPASISRTVGSKAAFRAGGEGALPISYQWYKGSTQIAGATNATLWLSNIQLSDDASTYYVHVSNAWNQTNSEPATLSVTARSAVVPITGYAKVVTADDPVGYWRLDEAAGSTVAVDAVGSFDGAYDATGAGNYQPGVFTFGAATGIPYETDKAVVVTNGARVTIPYALELNPYGPFAAEAWINPTSRSADSGDYRTIFSSEGSGVGGPIGWLLYQQPNHTFAWVVFADNWVSSFIGDPLDIIEANTWYHIVLQYDGSLFYIYVNGRETVSQAYPDFIPNRNGMINLGWRSDNDWKPFAGTIDDVAFYNKALTPDQIKTHYAATVRLSLTRSGNDIVLSWPFGTLQQADQANGTYVDMPTATSPYTNSPAVGQKFYRVKW